MALTWRRKLALPPPMFAAQSSTIRATGSWRNSPNRLSPSSCRFWKRKHEATGCESQPTTEQRRTGSWRSSASSSSLSRIVLLAGAFLKAKQLQWIATLDQDHVFIINPPTPSSKFRSHPHWNAFFVGEFVRYIYSPAWLSVTRTESRRSRYLRMVSNYLRKWLAAVGTRT